MINDYSFLFTNMNANNSFASIDFSTLDSIRNGSYRKLLNAYYDKNPSDTKKSEAVDSMLGAGKTGKVEVTRLRDDAMAVKDSVDELKSEKLWAKDDSDEYNVDGILYNVKDFINSYNALIKSADSSENATVARTNSNMTTFTRANRNALSSVGINVSVSGKLSVDEDVFRRSSMETVKGLLAGAGSYTDNIGASASMITGAAVSELAKLSGSGLYGSNGGYTYLNGTNFNSFF